LEIPCTAIIRKGDTSSKKMNLWWLVRFMMANGGMHYLKTIGQAAGRVLRKAGYDPATMASAVQDNIQSKFVEPDPMSLEDATKTLNVDSPYGVEDVEK
jgi:hypothetical protein